MNPRSLLNFLKSDLGKLLLFGTAISVAGVLVYSFRPSREQAGKKIEEIRQKLVPAKAQPVRVERNTAELVQPKTVEDPDASKKPEIMKEKPVPLPISLYQDSSQESELSEDYAPYGRLIPCETIITVDSARISTPIIGLVTEDLYHEGRLIIPAGAEVHGKAQTDRSRERIASDNHWVIVWRTSDRLNGSELPLSGLALDMERDPTSGRWALTDGSAGLRGDIIRTDNLAELKLFAATFLGAASAGLQETERATNVLTGDRQTTVLNTPRNAVIQGTTAVINEYARQILETIQRDGFYVRVPAGKQFYLYVTQTIDRGKANIAGSRLELTHSNEKEPK
jgi:hypothetical protein